MMEYISHNLGIIFGAIAIIAVGTVSFISFVEMPKAEKIYSVKEWLKWAVVESERMFGSKTGQLKLRYVYNLFVKTYPDLARKITFSDIEVWVVDALTWLNNQLENNAAVKSYIEDK